MKIVVSRSELSAALLFASTDESRYTLSGVCIEACPERKPVLVATDGRRLAVIETVAEQKEDFPHRHQLLLRPDFIKPICALSKAIGAKLFPWICFENNPGSKRIQVEFIGGNIWLDSHDGGLINGEYPAWAKALPARKARREPINDLGLNAEFVGDFAKAAKLLEASSPLIQMNLVGKEQALEVKINALPHFYGLVMPCKVEESTEYQPEFLQIVKDFPVKTEPEPQEEAA